MLLSALVALVDIKTSKAGSEKTTWVIETARKGKRGKEKKKKARTESEKMTG